MTTGPFIRKIGEPHVETIKFTLTDTQRDEERNKALEFRSQQRALARERSAAVSGFNQRKKDLEEKEEAAHNRASTGEDFREVIVQNYLAAGNEVVSVIPDEHDRPVVVAKRTATAEELQEELFGGDDEERSH